MSDEIRWNGAFGLFFADFGRSGSLWEVAGTAALACDDLTAGASASPNSDDESEEVESGESESDAASVIDLDVAFGEACLDVELPLMAAPLRVALESLASCLVAA